MWNRAIFIAALTIGVLLLARVYDTVETAIDVFPIAKDQIVFVHLDPAPWYSAVFIAAHACVAWCGVLIWKGNATLWLKLLGLLLLSELITIYLATLRFWYGGVDISLY